MKVGNFAHLYQTNTLNYNKLHHTRILGTSIVSFFDAAKHYEVPKAPPSNRFSINLVSTKIKTPIECVLLGFREVPSGIEPL